MTFEDASEFIAEWSQVLIPEWTITAKDCASPSEAACDHRAAVTDPGDYLRATLYLHEVTSDDTSDSDARQMLLHELLHLVLHDYHNAASSITYSLSSDTAMLASRTLTHHLERTVDRLADAFESITA